MSRFWQFTGLALFVLFVPAVLVAQLLDTTPRTYEWQPNLALRLYAIAWGCAVIAVVWAICFRPQVEQWRISLAAILSLIAMEAVFLAFLRIVQPFG
jgi:hypothetical protein